MAAAQSIQAVHAIPTDVRPASGVRPCPQAGQFFGTGLGASMQFPRNAEIFGEGEEAEFVYQVVRGVVRTSTILSDGRRQICSFYLPGDVFGLEAGMMHEASAEAVGATSVMVVRRSTLFEAASRDPALAEKLWSATARELQNARKHLLLLVRSAQERVASFLLEMAHRTHVSDTIELPMSRQDIADYLGLTIETVSRTLSNLETRSAIALPSARRVVLRNPKTLRALNS